MIYKNICVALISALLLTSGLRAQDDQPEAAKNKTKQTTKLTKEDIASAKKAYLKLKKSVKADDWKTAQKMMTKKAADQFCAEQVIGAKAMLESDFPMELPGMDDYINDLEAVFKKHKLDEIDIDTSGMFKMEMSFGDEDPEPSESEKPKEGGIHDHAELIAKALDKDNRRWKVIGDLWKAQKNSPFSVSPMTGEVEKEIAKGKHVLLKIKLTPGETEEQEGMQIQFMSPPVFVRLLQKDGKWMFDGIDEKETDKAMKEFMKNQGQFMDSMPRDDF